VLLMDFSLIIQVVVVILILLAAITAIFGPKSWLWVSAGFGLLAGSVIGVVQEGSLLGLRYGFGYGALIDVMFIPAGYLTRIIRDKEPELRKLYRRNKKDRSE
jgi:type IV secretory pathway TrbD component